MTDKEYQLMDAILSEGLTTYLQGFVSLFVNLPQNVFGFFSRVSQLIHQNV